MIQFCTCNKRFSSPIEIPKDQESSKSCGRCGGILSVDELGGLSRKMWSIMGPEFSLAIDPQLKWKTSSNGKHRALRRARIFTQDNGKKFTAKDTKDIEDLFDKVSKTEGDILVSESEKFGVSVLGRRFSDKFDKVPIKKRRLYLPPQANPHTLSSSGYNDHDHGDLFTVFQNNQVSFIEDASCIDSPGVVGQHHEKCSDDEKRGSGGINEHIHHTGDCDDFSGISILAAAACHSSIDKGFMDAEGITVTRHSSEENPAPLKLSKNQSSQPEHENIKQKHLEVSFITGSTPHSDPVQTKFDECNNLVSSVGSLHSFISKRKLLPSSGDRLNWDLNTVMDVWESQPEEFLNSDVKGNGSHGMEHVKHGLIQDEAGAGFGISKVGLAAVSNENISQSLIKEIDIQRSSPVVDCDGGKPGSLQAQVNESLLKEIQFTDTEAMVANAGEKTSEVNCERNCAVSANAHSVDDISDLHRDVSTNMVVATEQHKHEAVNVSYSVIPGCVVLERTMNDSDTFSKGKNIEEMLHDDRASIIILDSYDDHSEECNPAYVGKNNQPSSPHAEKHQPFSTTEQLNVNNPQQSVVGLLDQNTPGTAVIVDENASQVAHDGNSSKHITTEGLLDEETAYNHKILKSHANVNQSIVLWKETSDNEKVNFRNACANQHEETSTVWKEYNESKSCNLSCESLNASSAITFYISPKLKKSISEGNLLDRNDISFADNVLISPGDCKTHGHVRRSGKDSLEERYHSQHHSYAYSTVNNVTTGLEKAEILGDDDSQYEDGELRESVLNSWEEDEPQDVETEHVDYGSDCRDADCFEAESDLVVGTTDCTPEERMVSTSDGNGFQVAEVDSQSECLQKSFLVEDVLNANFGEGDFGKNIIENAVSKLPAKDENKLRASSIPTDFNDVPGKLCQPESSRIKSSGWDKLPRSENSAIRSVGGDYARRMTVLSTKRDLPNRVERSKSSEASCRKEVPYVMENRKHGQIDFNAERNANLGRPIGRTRLPFHTHGSGRGRGRGDGWAGSPEHHGSCRFDTSGCYSSSNFAPSGPTNAAAAAVAKAESNGCVVAPDGTIVKAGSMGSGSHLSRRSSKTSLLQSARRGSTMESDGALGLPSEPTSNSIRGVSPCRFFNIGRGRGSRYGSGGMVTLGQRNKYHHDSMLESGIKNLSLQHFSSRRQHSFSPHRKPMLVSHEHTRSPSRSRTQSPHTWTSPRGRDGGRMSGLPDVRRPSSRSPNFRTQRRILRHRSPQRHVIPAEDFGAYGPQSRSCSSPPHTSRWFENERILQGQLHEHHQPRRPPAGGSSPSKIFSHSNRLDHSDPRGKVIKPDEYYQPNYSGRFSEYAGYDNSKRGTRSRDGGRRGEVGRYDILHPEGHLESSGNMKCLRYESNGIRAHNFHRTKASGFPQREGPRTFYRSIDAQRENSPPRIKGEMVRFRHGRDVKLNADFKSFAVQNARDDMPLQRRPS